MKSTSDTRPSPRLDARASRASVPLYELRVRARLTGDTEMEVWQVPSRATPQLVGSGSRRVAGLAGRNLGLVEHRILKRLRGKGIDVGGLRRGEDVRRPIDEDLALNLGLLFRVLAPMRVRDNMRAVAEGIEEMGREEAAYWLGMAMHRRNPRRVLTALRILLTEPRRHAGATR